MDEKPPRRDRRTIVVAVLISVLWIVVLYVVGPRVDTPGSFGDGNVQYPASYDWELTDQDGLPIEFDRFKGKAIFLNIWATWCAPCIAEMPSIARLAENPRLKGKGIEFICVATDESADTVRKYLRGKEWGMTFLHADSIPKAYLTDGIPATFAISPDGMVVGAVEGSSDWDNPQVAEFLEKLAAARPQADAK